MRNPTLTVPLADEVGHDTLAFYRHVLESLNVSGDRFLVGGAYAFNHYTGISRHTKDLDIFIREQDFPQVSEALHQAGYETELTYPHWLAKAARGGDYIDLIFSSGNGVATVDDEWFDHAPPAEILGVGVRICPVEEMIWSKSFIMERERFDGADVAHLLHATGDQLDWHRLLRRFGAHWRVLLSHCVLFGFTYPDYRHHVPLWVMEELIERLRHEAHTPPEGRKICQGTLLSREQYLADVEKWGYRDARLVPLGNMTASETAHWTDAIKDKH
ncbi:MAG TPA: nucleotidyltransferase [Noviherbaspirillum sp.]